jgi:hypothetical protein
VDKSEADRPDYEDKWNTVISQQTSHAHAVSTSTKVPEPMNKRILSSRIRLDGTVAGILEEAAAAFYL